MNRLKVKDVTEGSLFCALYLIIFYIANFTPDSLFYLLIPIPMIIFVYRHHFFSSSLVTGTVVLLAFLFGNPFNVLFYLLPNLWIGLLYGEMSKKKKPFPLIFLLVFLASVATDILGSYLWMELLGVDLFSDLSILKNWNVNLYSIMMGAVPAVFILTAMFKTILIKVISDLLLVRMNLKEQSEPFHVIFHPLISLISFIFLLLFNLAFYLGYRYDGVGYTIFFNFTIVIFMLLILYLVLETSSFVSFLMKKKKLQSLIPLMSLLFTIFFPITSVIGFILNFIPKRVLFKEI